MKRLILLTELFLTIFIGTSLQAQPKSEVNLSFKDKIGGWLTENNVPTAGIGVIENGKIKYVKVFGELEKGVPAPDNTIFNVASVTKTVVVMLTLKLVDKGQWDLDEPLSDYWVDPDVAGDSLLPKLTTRRVLTHTTGFPNWRSDRPDHKLAFEFAPGTKYQYSGEGFEYLRHALEHKFKKPLERLTDSLIFKPLGMKDTHQSWDSTMDEPRFAFPHDVEGNKIEVPYKTGVSAADNLLTTVKDYCRFGLFVMKGGGLSPALFSDMVTPHSNIQKHSAMGLGWFLINGLPNGKYAIYHMGGDPGVKNMAFFLPKSKCGVVIFTNGDNGTRLYNNVIKAAFDSGDSIYEYMYERPNMPKMVHVSDGLIKEYTGHYQNPDVEIVSKRSDQITLTVGGLPKSDLYPESENKFFMREYDIQVQFVKDSTGQVANMVLYFNGNKAFETQKVK
jgi:CubicO group peptidase (beta-lactamase class C family)